MVVSFCYISVGGRVRVGCALFGREGFVQGMRVLDGFGVCRWIL